MNKNIKKITALVIALTSVCSIGNVAGIKLFEEAYASSSVLDKGELKSLYIKSIEGDNMELLKSFDKDDIAEYDGKDKEYKVILPKGSDGIKVSADVKKKKKSDDKDEDYTIRIFTSNKEDAKAYKTGDDIYLYDDFTTLYIRTYKSEEKFKDLNYDGDVRNSSETYKVLVKKEEALDEDYKGSTALVENIALPKINISSVAAESKVKNNEWIKNGEYWIRYNEDGQVLKNSWLLDGGKYYYLQANGYMTTGWRFIEGDWYYFNQSGEMTTGWIKTEDGIWFYLMPSGKKAKNTVIDGYKLNSKGEYIG